MNSLPNFSKSFILIQKSSCQVSTSFQNVCRFGEVDNIEYGIVTPRKYT